MQKQIFSEEDIVQPTETFQAKQIFGEKEAVIEEDLNAYQYLDAVSYTHLTLPTNSRV